MGVRIEHLADHEAHLAKVAQWQQAQFGYLNPTGTIEQRTVRLREALQKDRLPMSLVAVCEGGGLAGSASIVAATLTHQHLTPWLSSVFVPMEQRGKGIASALSLRASDEAGRIGFRTLYLFTPHSEALYARIGWQTIDRHVHNGLPLAIMSRPTGT